MRELDDMLVALLPSTERTEKARSSPADFDLSQEVKDLETELRKREQAERSCEASY